MHKNPQTGFHTLSWDLRFKANLKILKVIISLGEIKLIWWQLFCCYLSVMLALGALASTLLFSSLFLR